MRSDSPGIEPPHGHIELFQATLDPARRPSKLRVVYLSHTAALSGGELALLRLLPALTDEIEPHVILAEDGPLVSRLLRPGVSVEVLAMSESARGTRRDALDRDQLPELPRTHSGSLDGCGNCGRTSSIPTRSKRPSMDRRSAPGRCALDLARP